MHTKQCSKMQKEEHYVLERYRGELKMNASVLSVCTTQVTILPVKGPAIYRV